MEAAGLKGHLLSEEIELFASHSGWLSNCDTVDEFTSRLLARYPAVKAWSSAVGVLRRAFVEGREMAGRRRRSGDQTGFAEGLVMESMREVTMTVPRLSNHEEFGEMEEVPLLDEEGEETVVV